MLRNGSIPLYILSYPRVGFICLAKPSVWGHDLMEVVRSNRTPRANLELLFYIYPYMNNRLFEQVEGNEFRLISENKQMDNPCWKGYQAYGTKEKDGKTVPNCVPKENLDEYTIEEDEELLEFLYFLKEDRVINENLQEADHRGKNVKLNKPMRGDVKKFKVYVKDPNSGNIKKVNFGDKNMRIKKNNPERRKSFRARHRCDNPGPKTKARYWSCKKW